MHSLSPSLTRRALLRSVAAAPLLLSGLARAADDFPSRPLRLVVPFPAGGSSDALGRVLAAALAKTLGTSVIVENRGGAGGNIAGDYAARAAADGYTLLMAGQGILAINQPLYGHLSYDPAAFEYIGMMGDNANVLLANPQTLPVASVAALVAEARKRPGEIAYGSNGIGSLSHLTAEIFANAAQVKFLHVPYQGAAPMATDLRAGRIAFCVTGSTLAVSLSKGGGLRPLAVTTGVRLPQLPDTPTLVESGYPALEAPSWWATMAPAHTPAPVLARLREAFAAATSTPEYRHALEQQSTLPHPMDAAAAGPFLANERKKWATAVQSSGAKAS
ncbi:tripartite tricarboxylate transporter substrate binding protein [Bordetella sp. N]|uniref:Bug family tripartite tricarboxylate transporter substrate binding protein n=1 Tax=Bordetella sp. N TaxID=1746199 RepID=UPI000B267115|nr:tripartite tricarboxylate transporter substrate binding protein [Bordetella sp. N]